jgi:nicotinamidase-related amidase
VQFAKRWYSGFHETGLGMYLRQHDVGTVILVGQHAHICVQHTAGDAFIEGFRVVLAEDGISAFTPADQAAGLAYMQQMYGATLSSVDEVLAAPAAA